MAKFSNLTIPEQKQWYIDNGEEIGKYYMIHMVFGLIFFTLIGAIKTKNIFKTLICSVLGLIFGMGLGLLHMASMISNEQ